jgi:hypothetical protein
VSVASPEEAVEFRSLQLACRDSDARNENLQEQMANVQVSLSEANSRVGELQARLSSHQQSFSQSRALSHPSNGVSRCPSRRAECNWTSRTDQACAREQGSMPSTCTHLQRPWLRET